MRPFLVLLALASALALAACDAGDTEEKNDYVGEVNEVNERLSDETSKALDEAGAITSPESAAGLYATLSKQLSSAAKEIEAIEPPSDVADLHARLVGQIETLSSEAKNASDELQAGGAAGAAGIATQFIAEANAQSARIDATLSEINGVLQG